MRAAETFERETRARIQRVMTVLPVALIISLAFLVTLILAAVLLPIINMQTGVPS